MPSLTSRCFSVTVLLLAAVAASSQDLRIRQSITVDGNPVSITETYIKGSRERIESQLPTGSSIVLKQCDLKRTVTLHEESQTYSVAHDPKEQAGPSTSVADSGAYITETSVITDTGQAIPKYNLPAHRMKTVVTVQPSKGACTQVSQKYEVDGWYVDLPQEQAACQAFLPPVREGEGCHDPIIRRRSGNGKPGFPLKEWITLHDGDDTTTLVVVKATNVHKEELEPELFEIPPGYQEVK